MIINLENGMLFPLDRKPQIHPVLYQGKGAGKGEKVFTAGSYLIGDDMPIGTYRMKNELHGAMLDKNAKGYHGNVKHYFAGDMNWCGLRAGSLLHLDGDSQKMGWKTMELDSRTQRFKRSLKIETVTVTNGNPHAETVYKNFWGLPAVTSSEKDIGAQVKVEGCILIPEKV